MKNSNTVQKKIRVQIILTPRIVERLDAAAEARTMSRSLLIRELCERGLKNSQQSQIEMEAKNG